LDGLLGWRSGGLSSYASLVLRRLLLDESVEGLRLRPFLFLLAAFVFFKLGLH
jgi:hypothetical protein